jgi:hypothetical protein
MLCKVNEIFVGCILKSVNGLSCEISGAAYKLGGIIVISRVFTLP